MNISSEVWGGRGEGHLLSGKKNICIYRKYWKKGRRKAEIKKERNIARNTSLVVKLFLFYSVVGVND